MSQQTDIAELIQWNDEGLVPAIAQDWQTGDVLMLAWMNAESLALTMAEKRAVYWSRSRQAVWRKGEEGQWHQYQKKAVVWYLQQGKSYPRYLKLLGHLHFFEFQDRHQARLN